jgi:hypothetical protein
MDDAHADSEFEWDPLIELIGEGGVIPIVGPDLITVESDGKAMPLYTWLAARLAARLKLDAPPEQLATLNQVAGGYLDRHGERDFERVYSGLKAVMPVDADLTVPEALANLARITPLKLFVSTTFDNLLERAINAERCGGQPGTRVIAYSPQHPSDLPCTLEELKTPTVFQLMGQLSAVAYEYAVTEEDVVEFLHSLQSGGRSPNRLFDELNRNHILIIGSGFSDWLARFFIRLAQNDRLWMARGATTIADQRTLDDHGLLDFLHHYSQRTRVFQAGAADFVKELSARWAAHREQNRDAHPEWEPSPITAGAVFLSYASEDRPVVEAISDALQHAQIPVWFDRQQLKSGDQWEKKISEGLSKCSLFAPIISKHSFTPEARFFREEWVAAEKVVHQLPSSRNFVVPVAVDDISPEAEQVKKDVPEAFQKAQWVLLPDGRVTPDFVDRVKDLFRQYKLAQRAAP